jgi:hypothetical protein
MNANLRQLRLHAPISTGVRVEHRAEKAQASMAATRLRRDHRQCADQSSQGGDGLAHRQHQHRAEGAVDLTKGMATAARLQYGDSWVNTHLMLASEMPHGGLKSSGYGKDLSMYALEDYTIPRHIMVKL